jgi:hypothetical protein
LFDGHQNGPTAAEDFIRRDLTRATPAVKVENGQQGAGTARRGMAETAQFRRRRCGGAQQHAEQDMDGRQADAARLARGGELGLLVPVHNDGESEATLQLGAQPLQVGHLPAEAGEFFLVGARV